MANELLDDIEALGAQLAEARRGIATRIIGQERVVDLALAAMLSGGHALLMGLPGLGKTRLVETLATVMGLSGNRIQFTPDLMPADILGSEVLETGDGGARAFRYLEGPIFAQLLMADEINRASPRTQSALLQAMQEREVTVAGQTRALPAPFHVLATQNPIEQEGTYPLPEAQLDRFLVRIDVDYPDRATERAIVLATTGASEAEAVQVFDAPALIAAQQVVRRMPVGEGVVDLILDLVRACRPEDGAASEAVRSHVAWGPGPRAAQALMLTARAQALLEGRLAPSPEDVARLARPVLMHRMALSFAARAEGRDPGIRDRRNGRPDHPGRPGRVSDALHTPATLRARSEQAASALPGLLLHAERLAATVMMGEHGRKRAGPGDAFWQYRAAQPGDSRRAIDWRQSGRSDGHYVRETEWQAAQTLMLWVDDAASMRFAAAGRPSKLRRAQTLALALAALASRAGERTGLASLAEPPRAGRAQLSRMADALMEGGEAPEYGAPRPRVMPMGARAVFLSDFLGDPAPLREALAAAADRGVEGTLVQVLDPEEEAFPYDGRTVFESMSGAIRFETLKAGRLREDYLGRLRDRRAALRDLCARTGWRFVLHHTDASAEALLLSLHAALGPRR